MTRRVELEIPPAFLPLWEPHRYKVLYGGRNSTKSWTIARVLIAMATEKKIRILCAREIQNSIQESVHQLLQEQIAKLGLGDKFDIQKTVIYGKNGSEFFFSGLKHKIDSIKSTEGIDICWVEEAHTVSKSSWDKLSPTIRKPGSEIWISFNPELDSDETYKRFVLAPPEGAWVNKVSYKDNPWVSDEMKAEMRTTRLRSEDDYQNIWLGFTKQALEGAVYAKELREAQADGRITRVSYSKAHPVSTYWDLGFHDSTAIWFAQKIGFDVRIIDYYENRQELLAHYVAVLQEKGYVYEAHNLPHDAANNDLRALSIEKQLKELIHGKGKVVILPREDVAAGINAVRTMFPQMWFDEEKCAEGIQALRRYRYEVDEETNQFSRRPLHDNASHPADALRYMAMSARAPRAKPDLQLVKPSNRRPELRLSGGAGRAQHAWLGR